MKNYFKTLLAVGLFGVLSLSTACSPVHFNPVAITSSATTNAIKEFQPALAVRDTSCIICHANIQSNVITDFGYGSPWYMNGGDLQPAAYGEYHYLATTWQSLQSISGQVIVPQATVPASAASSILASSAQPPTSPVALSDFLTMTNIIDIDPFWVYQTWNKAEPSNLALTGSVIPSAGSSAVISKAQIYIGVPTASQILGIVNNTSAAPWVQALSGPSGISGFSAMVGANGTSYITNSGTVHCSGQDVVVNGTLFLNNVQILAESGGCRLYVTGPVFIVGPITYLNSGAVADPTDNIQITSSTAIVMGVGLSDTLDPEGTSNPLNNRLLVDYRQNLLLRSAPSTSAYLTLANGIYAEATNIGSSLLVDASNFGTLPTALSAENVKRAQINFQHILLNAPIIHSRYLGTISGVIVAESGVFSLGEFSFEYDSIFESVPVFPALPVDILCAGDGSGSCNPAQL